MTRERPYTLIAELTYRCPLRCPYCSNPVDYQDDPSELATADWTRIFSEAEGLGVVQLHLTGGEPLVRKDLEGLIAQARSLDFYTNLITSGVPLTRARLKALRAAGLDNVQLSIQAVDKETSDRIAGYASFDTKIEVARWIKDEGLPLTLNMVLHRHNLDDVEKLIALGESLSADRLELANTQYHGWASLNRDALMPTAAQLSRAHQIAAAARVRLEGKMDLVYVTPDYHATLPKACMDGWARRYIHVVPNGTVLPCHAAQSITTLSFENAQSASLSQIWNESPAFKAFRGERWMSSTCRDCSRREIDFGGCRCQAFALTGDATKTDPACSLSPDHALVTGARALDTVPAHRFLHRGKAST